MAKDVDKLLLPCTFRSATRLGDKIDRRSGDSCSPTGNLEDNVLTYTIENLRRFLFLVRGHEG